LRVPAGFRLSNACVAMLQGRPSDAVGIAQLDPQVDATLRHIGEATTQDALDAMSLPGLVYGESELVHDGARVPVTLENRRLFARMVARRVSGADAPQGAVATVVRAMRAGMTTVLGESGVRKIRDMDPAAFSAMLGGVVRVSAVDLLARVSTAAAPGVDVVAAALVADAFHRRVRDDMDDDGRALLLRFWTGSPVFALPGKGDGHLQLILTPDVDGGNRRPHSHTCFRQLCMPVTAPGLAMRRLDEALANCDAVCD
jgi:hypothetical protein